MTNLFTQSKFTALQEAIAQRHRDSKAFDRLQSIYLKEICLENYSLESLLVINHLLSQNPKNFCSLFLHKLKNIDFLFVTHPKNTTHLARILKIHPQDTQRYFCEFVKKIKDFNEFGCTQAREALYEAKKTITLDRNIRLKRFCSNHQLQDIERMLFGLQASHFVNRQ